MTAYLGDGEGKVGAGYSLGISHFTGSGALISLPFRDGGASETLWLRTAVICQLLPGLCHTQIPAFTRIYLTFFL